MSETTEIPWCDSTWSPWRGCDCVSEGCANCYITSTTPFRISGQKHGDPRVIASDATFNAPLRWNKKPWVCDVCGKAFEQLKGRQKLCEPIIGDPCQHCNFGHYRRRRVFSLSLGDIWDPKIPVEWLARALDIIPRCEDIDFLLCTKRPENFWERLKDVIQQWYELDSVENWSQWAEDWMDGIPPRNVWILTSAENQERYDERRPHAEAIPAVVHGWSMEPLLGPITLHKDDKATWCICGGESGKQARPCNVDWIRSIKDQCKAAGTACFVKQLGSNPFGFDKDSLGECDICLGDGTHHPTKAGLKYHGWDCYRRLIKHPKGGAMSEWPTDCRVRQFPEVGR